MEEREGVGGLTTREIVQGRLLCSDAVVDIDISSECGFEDGVLESLRVMQVDVDLACLAGIRGLGVGTDLGLEGVEEEGETITTRLDTALLPFWVCLRQDDGGRRWREGRD